MNQPKNNKKRLILDSNVFQYGCDGKYTSEVLRFLGELAPRFSFALSSITTYEFYGGLHGGKSKKRIENANIFKQTFPMIAIDDDHLRTTAALRTCYICNEKTKSFERGINFADTLIGATAISLNAYVLTGNSNDFPMPFFDEKEIFILKPTAEREQKISIVQPDIKFFNQEVRRIYQ